MKKRILSMLLAVVMVLSMVPVQALAEATPEESVAETVVNETEVQETETQETEAQETETQETETQETEPQETEVQETGEETKSQETEPAETTEETVVTPEAEAEPVGDAGGADATVAIVPVEETMDGEICVGGDMQLKVANSSAEDVKWTSLNEDVATVSEDGWVHGLKVGSATIQVTCTIKVDGESLSAEGSYVVVVEDPVEPNYTIVIEENNPTDLIAGDSIQLKAHVESDDETSSLPLPLIKWTLVDPKDAGFVKVAPDGTVTAAYPDMTVKWEDIPVQVSFVKKELNEKAEESDTLPDPVTISVYPRIHDMKLLVDDSDEDIKDGEYCFNLNDTGLLTAGIQISADLEPEDAISKVRWTVNDSRDLCHWDKDATDSGSITIKPVSADRTGTVTVVATALDTSGVSKKLVIRFEKMPTEVEILNAPDEMRGLSSVTLTTNVASMSGLTDKTILWSVTDVDGKPTQYARIDAKGKLTTSRVEEPVNIVVHAKTRLGEIEANPVTITIVPAVESIEIAVMTQDIKPGNVPYSRQGTIELEAKVNPENAIQEVTWGTSNKNIASVDNDGVVTICGAGKVRISAMAKDGSKKVGYLYLTITKPVYEVHFNQTGNPEELRSGKSKEMGVTAWTHYDRSDPASGVVAVNQNMTWEVFEVVDGALEKTTKAVITSKGKLSVKDIQQNAEIVVRATSKEKAPADADEENLDENGYAFDEYHLIIKPADRYNFLLKLDGGEVTGKTIEVNNHADFLITGAWYDSDTGVEEEADSDALTFRSSSKSVADFDEDDGWIETFKTGTTTITVMGEDGNGDLRSAKFKLKVTNLVQGITITEPKSRELRSGKSMSLKAVTWTVVDELKATNQKVTWRVTDLSGNPTKAATVSSGGTVKAGTVVKDTYVRVTATSVEKGLEADIELMIRPKQEYSFALGIKNWDYDNTGEYAYGTVTVPYNHTDINEENLLYNLVLIGYTSKTGEEGFEDDDAGENVKWSTSNKKIVSIEEDGALKVHKAGKVTLTAKKTIESTLASGKTKTTTVSAKITLNLVVAVEKIDVVEPTQKLYAGKTLSMRALINEDSDIPVATNRRLKWSLDPGDEVYATINPTSGLITANREVNENGAAKTITVSVESADGFGCCEAETQTVTILPTAKKITALCDDEEVDLKYPYDANVGDELKLGIRADPNDADPDVKWASSRTSVAYIKWDEKEDSYVLVAKKRGSATITATALDGSGKTAKFIINVSAS